MLRPYQTKALEDCRQAISQGFKKLLLCMPTGSGKTSVSTQIIQTASERGYKCVFLVHRVELIRQTLDTFNKFNINCGVIAAGWEPKPAAVQIASIPTLYRRLGKLPNFDLVIIDEAVHAIDGNSWGKVLQSWPDAWLVGLTATPQRLSGEGLNIFDRLILGPSVSELIDMGYLAPYKLYAPEVARFDKCHVRAGDYISSEVEDIINRPAIIGDVIDHYKTLSPNRRTVVFCATVAHSKNVAAQFNAVGFKAVHVDGNTPDNEREQAIEDFKSGRIKILTNCNLFVEGVDLPALETLIMLRPTKSLSLYLQAVGRALRPYPNKTALILDHVGNTFRHGLPDDPHEWTLEGKSKKNRNDEKLIAIKTCPKCYAVYRPRAMCPYCGAESVKEITIKEKKGALQEVKRIEQRHARTLEELIELGKTRGYKNPSYWAYKVSKGRKNERK